MVNSGNCLETCCRVAIFAAVSTVDVGRVFTCGTDTVVTGRTIPSRAAMIKYSARPIAGSVTIITGISARDVVCGLAHCAGTVVARATST
jgi:hypothetical protein